MNDDLRARATALLEKAHELRRQVLHMVFDAQSGHIASCFSCAEILAVIFYAVLRDQRHGRQADHEDVFLLSKGHASALLYAILADIGKIDRDELRTFRQIGTRLQGHPSSTSTPGVLAPSGSLGQGLSVGCGIAYAAAMMDRTQRSVYVLLGDGELNEGQVWEAAMFAGHNRLGNLVAIVDRNRLQFVGPTEQVLSLEPLEAKWRSFGWSVVMVPDGHDILQLLAAFAATRAEDGRPSVIIAETRKGKGVSFMEHSIEWHGKAPNAEEFLAALKELGECE